MNYGSVCSGIEAATVAWDYLRWQAVFYSEIEPAPCAVLKHYYPDVPNLGDMTQYRKWPSANLNVLVGGTPCQSFSVAGLRKGLDDPRGNLTLVYLGVAYKYRPYWLVWENVPGVLSDGTGAFGSFLGGLAELGYGFAYRVLDAQYVRVESHSRAVPQRRRRVFVVGCLGGWQRAAAVLFERESMCGHPPPRRQPGQRVAPTIAARTRGGGGLGTDFDCDGGLIASTGDVSHCLNAGDMGRQDYETETLVASVAENQRGELYLSDVTNALAQAGGKPGQGYAATIQGMRVRRLIPVECERLQGFRDNYTLVPFRGRPMSDGQRYKMLGNSMAVPVMRWIGERIAMAESLCGDEEQSGT
jgi:DNA (cytosine-5)-methyltransferase 1